MSCSKSVVREKMSALRDGYEKTWLEECSSKVCTNILKSSYYKNAQKIFAYLAFGNEVNVDSVISQALSDGKIVYVPHIVLEQKGIIQPVRLKSFADIVLGKYDIRTVRQPLEAALPSDMDVILTPGLCFDRTGVRMGLGAGFYDRLLAKSGSVFKIGVTLSPQIVKSVPSEEHDVLMDCLVYENGFIICNNKVNSGGENIG